MAFALEYDILKDEFCQREIYIAQNFRYKYS